MDKLTLGEIMPLSKTNIGVVFPSRGMVFTETLQELLRELSDVPHTIYWSHGNKLPSCFNKPLSRALNGQHSHIWLVEDDMVLKKGILKELLDADEDLIACDYTLVDAPSGTILHDENDEAFLSGTGCLLVKKKVLDEMPRPIFTSKIKWTFRYGDGKVKFFAQKADPLKAYGMHDISFGLYHYMRGNPIKVATTILYQRKLAKKGENATNQGTDTIKIYDQYKKITPLHFPEEKEKDSRLRTVTIDGKKVMIMKKAVSEVLKKIPDPIQLTRGRVILDFEEFPEASKVFEKLLEAGKNK